MQSSFLTPHHDVEKDPNRLLGFVLYKDQQKNNYWHPWFYDGSAGYDTLPENCNSTIIMFARNPNHWFNRRIKQIQQALEVQQHTPPTTSQKISTDIHTKRQFQQYRFPI